MKLLKFLLPFALVTNGFSFLAAAGEDDAGFSSTISERERDIQAVEDYINSKRAVSIKEKGGDLRLSGDIRMEYTYAKAKTDGVVLRGYDSKPIKELSKKRAEWKKKVKDKATSVDIQEAKDAYKEAKKNLRAPFPTSEFEIEANLVLDYVADRCWGTMRLQMSNPAGLPEIDRKPGLTDSRNMLFGSGSAKNLSLRKAYMGYNVWEQGTSRFDIEIGRRKLYDAFDSQIQFYSMFDGILAKFSSSYEGITDFYAKIAGFVVDQNANHWGRVGEIGFMNIADSGLDLKYSLIDWSKCKRNRYGKKDPMGAKFLNSQITATYNVSPDLVRMKTQLYGAFLVNHKAKKCHQSEYQKANKAYYLGFRLGDVVRKGDYAFDVAYQWVQAQAISERDIYTMGRDNPTSLSLYVKPRGGWANYKGFKIDAFYAITDNWTVNAYVQDVHQQSIKTGGKHHSYQFSIASIFAF